jgi:peptide/nickel transport system permease protein
MSVATLTQLETTPRRTAEMGQWALIWRRFRRHRLAFWSGVIILAIYLVAVFAEFVAPYSSETYDATLIYSPPQSIRFFGTDAKGNFAFAYVTGFKMAVDPVALTRGFTEDTTRIYPLGLFVAGEPYKLMGLIPWDRHLIGPVDPSAPMHLWGTDRIGRDLLSRTIHGARVSMSIGLVGVGISLFRLAACRVIMAAGWMSWCSAPSTCSNPSPPFRCGWAWRRQSPSAWIPCWSIFGSPSFCH